jgi:hypothetical protein
MLLMLPVTSGPQQLPSIAEQVAKTWDLDSFGKPRQFATLGMRNFLVSNFHVGMEP